MSDRGESLVARIVGFFQRNPDEFLTYEDMAVKFDCTPERAAKATENAVTLGMCESREVIKLVRLRFGEKR
jgi:hypothetical protein